MIVQRTSVGLDAHAASMVGCAIDEVTWEVTRRRLAPALGEVIGWLASLPGPVAMTYEAGPTGFGLARAITAAGMECVVAAPSKLQRPVGEPVLTDARDAMHLARCCGWARSWRSRTRRWRRHGIWCGRGRTPGWI